MKTLMFTQHEDGRMDFASTGFSNLEIIGIGEIIAVRARLAILNAPPIEPTPSDSSTPAASDPSHTPNPA